jgi:hypothetical protein
MDGARSLRRATAAVLPLALTLLAGCTTVAPSPLAATPNESPTTAHACRAEDLAATATWEGATGSLAGAITVLNIGSDVCVLDGPPPLVELFGGDVPLNVAYGPVNGPGPGTEGVRGPAALAPGGEASAFLLWSNWCKKLPNVVTSARVTLPAKGGQIVAVIESGGVPRCDDQNGPSRLGVWAFVVP